MCEWIFSQLSLYLNWIQSVHTKALPTIFISFWNSISPTDCSKSHMCPRHPSIKTSSRSSRSNPSTGPKLMSEFCRSSVLHSSAQKKKRHKKVLRNPSFHLRTKRFSGIEKVRQASTEMIQYVKSILCCLGFSQSLVEQARTRRANLSKPYV